EMFDFQLYRKLSLMAAALGFLTWAACANQLAMAASRQPTPAANDAASKAAPASTVADAAHPTQPLRLVTLPKGTKITATVDQTLASDKNHWGDSFEASLARPVKVDGKTVLPRGTEVKGRILEVKKHELKVVLVSTIIDGVFCDLATNSRRPSDKDQPKNSNRKKNKDNSTLSAKTRLTFKLSKPATIPAKA